MIKVGIKDNGDDGMKDLANKLLQITKMQVYVGIPENKSGRRGDAVTNAQLMYIHTHGSALRGIPARPVIEPAIEASGNKERITGELKTAARSTLDHKEDEATKYLKRAGMAGQNAARDWFEDPRNGWAPNKANTVKQKGSDRPLIDTGQLRKSIIYVVRGESGE